MPADPETRRGLPVKRPRGMPFSYTVAPRFSHPGAFEIRVQPDGCDSRDPIRVRTWGKGSPAELWHNAASYYHEGTYSSLETAENFALALRWAVRYARRWNAKHCPEGVKP